MDPSQATAVRDAFAAPLLEALRAVPKGGFTIEVCREPAASFRSLLDDRRGDFLIAAAPAGQAGVHASPVRLPMRDRSALSVLLNPCGLARHTAEQFAEAGRVATRYLVVPACRRSLFAKRGHADMPEPSTHEFLEGLAAEAGFRPLARAAAGFWTRLEWCYVFVRTD